MSSFRRAGTLDTGTRPGLHGQTLISMGLVDLDRILAGGLPLASVLLLLEDPCSGQHLNILRYFMAEGVKCRQRVLWLTAAPPPGGPGAFLPAEAGPSTSSTASEEATVEQPELRIAWQYKKYIKDDPYSSSSYSQPYGQGSGPAGRAGSTTASSSGRSAAASASSAASKVVAAGVGREWCHSYDLTKPMGEEGLRDGVLEVAACCGPTAYATADRLSSQFLGALAAPQEIQPSNPSHQHQHQHQQQSISGSGLVPGAAATASTVTAARRSGGVGRLVIESAGGLDWGGSGGGGCSGGGGAANPVEQQLLWLLYNVRQRVQQTRCAALVTVPAGLLTPGCAARLLHLADTVLALESLADDLQLVKLLPDPTSAVALLSIRKLCAAGMLGPRLPDAGHQLFVVRHKRRRLGLSPVEVDPDAEDRAAEAAARAAEAYSSKVGSGGSGAAGGGGGADGGAAGRGAAGRGGKSSAAAVLCGGPPARDNKALDF